MNKHKVSYHNDILVPIRQGRKKFIFVKNTIMIKTTGAF